MGFTSFAPPLSQGGTIAGNLAVTGSVTAGSSPGGPLGELVGTTGAAGFALQDATPTIIGPVNVPNDGNLHRATVVWGLNVTSAETGGAVAMEYTGPGGNAVTPQLSAGGAGAGETGTQFDRVVKPGSTVSVVQTSALTAGAATGYAELWIA